MFIIATVLFWWLLVGRPVKHRYIFTIIGCTLFACVTEGIQKVRGIGTPSFSDLAFDLLATALTLAFIYCLSAAKANKLIAPRLGMAGTALLFSLFAVVPVLLVNNLYAHRNSIYPELVDYSSARPLFFHSCRATCELTSYQDPAGTSLNGLNIYLDQSDWPGVNLMEVIPPKSIHTELQIDFKLPGNGPLELFVIANPSSKKDQANTVSYQVYPGDNSLRIPLIKLLTGKASQETSLRIGLFTSAVHLNRQLLIKGVRYGS